jgi:hypothetical protein
MHGQVIKPPNIKDILRAAIKSYLQAPTIQIRQTRENNITVKKNVAEEEPCKASIGYSSASRTSEVAIYVESIDSRADFRDMASKPKPTINQETEISDNVLPLKCNITHKQQE